MLKFSHAPTNEQREGRKEGRKTELNFGDKGRQISFLPSLGAAHLAFRPPPLGRGNQTAFLSFMPGGTLCSVLFPLLS